VASLRCWPVLRGRRIASVLAARANRFASLPLVVGVDWER
jgi:hypothetical protein